MIKLVRFAKQYWYMIAAIVLMLVVQAYCELSLPQYTSDIVDVGIQYAGVERAVPMQMREESFEALRGVMEEQDRALLDRAYEFDTQKNLYLLNEEALGSGKKERNAALESLEEAMIPGEAMLYGRNMAGRKGAQAENEATANGAEAQNEATANGARAQNEAAANGAEAQNEASAQGEAGDGGSSDMDALAGLSGEMLKSMGKSMAISFVQSEYRATGIDLDHLQMGYLGKTGAKMLGLTFLGMLAAIAVSFLSSRMAALTARDLRNRVFEKVVTFSSTEMDRYSTASLITRCTNDIQQVQMVLMMLFRMVAYAPIVGIGGIVKVLKTGTSMAWIIAVAVAAVVSLVFCLMRVAMPKFKIMQSLVDRLNLVSREILTGVPVIRAFSREKHEEKRFDGASRDLMRTQLFTNRAMALMMPTMMLIMNGITVLIIWVGAHGIDMGSLQVGDMMAFITYTMQIVMAFLMITMVSVMLPRAAVAAERIQDVLDTEVTIRNAGETVKVTDGARGEVEFRHVSFRYPNAGEDALMDIGFTARPGETTAIIGSTGCGKSTLVGLIPRLYDVTEGSLLIDGVDIRNYDLHGLREMIGFVPQKGTLFSGTIESNIRFGAQDATDGQMEEAAAIAQATEFIESKASRYETPIAQGGGNVSGGQKQRLAIARAIAKNPKIYVFDDSFSALDYKTDIALRRALKKKTDRAAVLIVAQRISTILHADKIIVLDEGRIAGIGTHEELLAGNEVYQQIAMSQMSKDELAGKIRGKEA